MAARGLITLFRVVNPKLLHRKDRGRLVLHTIPSKIRHFRGSLLPVRKPVCLRFNWFHLGEMVLACLRCQRLSSCFSRKPREKESVKHCQRAVAVSKSVVTRTRLRQVTSTSHKGDMWNSLRVLTRYLPTFFLSQRVLGVGSVRGWARLKERRFFLL